MTFEAVFDEEKESKEFFTTKMLAQQDLYFFSRYMFKARRGFKWQRAQHHKKICEALMGVYKGDCKRLIINIPPRYSKTELAVINFISWSLGKAPDAEFIHTSYSARLAANNSWQTRELVSSEEFRALFPDCVLRNDSQAKDEWRTELNGCVYATGAEGTITGYGAGKMRPEFGGAIIIDDPHKPDEIRSDVVRPKVIEWFQDTLESRKNSKDTPIILVMQRLHEEDLSGWLLAGGNKEHWTHINLPALREDNSALWPEKHSVEDLLRMQEAKPWTFSSQYQQKPTPPAGGIFKPDMINVLDALPQNVRSWMRAWDLAATTDDGDWTVGALIGQTIDNRHIVSDVVRLQGSPDKVEAAITNTAKFDGHRVKVSLPQDPGQAGKSQVAYLTRALSGFRVHSSPESGDKVTRAEPFASQVNVGAISIMRGEWNHSFIHELRNFPFAKHDDQVDATARGFNMLNEGSSYDSSLSWVA